jgi:hypothetical protein
MFKGFFAFMFLLKHAFRGERGTAFIQNDEIQKTTIYTL